DLDTSDVLAAKDAHGRFRPASTLKLLTMNVLLRNLKNPNQVVIGTDEDARQEGSRVGIGDGGKYTVRQLMTYLLLGSGNDVANALARANGGTAKTIQQMNARAKALGALDTRAATVSGLDGPGQMTSAYDLALIARSDMSLPPFPQLTATQYAQVPGFGPYKGFSIANENKLLSGYPGALGGKTGFTNDAGNTYVGLARKDGRRLVVTMLDGSQQPRPQWMQAASLLDWGFALPDNSTPVGRLVSSGAQATDTAPTPSIPPATHRSTLTLDAGSSSAAVTVAVSSLAAVAAAPATPPTSGGSRVLIWIVLVLVVVLAAFAVVMGLRTSGSRRSGRHTG
ncbi:MAG: D-alanyl-D-alanine carboxypeptidase family protein, partial [Nakamurella sp.]